MAAEFQFPDRDFPPSNLNDIRIRRFCDDDSIDELTSLLHRAFARLGRMGLACTGVEQSPEMTLARVRRGTCFVAVRGDRIAGTMTLETPGPRQPCEWYRRTEVASLHQFGVDPSEQRLGCGTRLLQFAERWTAGQRYAELALDTPSRAAHLVDFYAAHGFRRVGEFQQHDKAYTSVILSKRLAQESAQVTPWHSPRRSPWCGSLVSC